ncbi:nucleotidyltransferase domain-containing protein [Vitreimonas sp.]|uniref:nucleotidyltransferase domain-containing protein n=1 Tax=Vitreimonas sp. TaxID=3069702 RepID=UPI002D79D3CF|nr:nucleotidyltransferase domain-containing protein [Vitreimonas sp.]
MKPALEILRRESPQLAAVYLFGSCADGYDRSDSDIDLAFYAGRPIERGRVLELQEHDLAIVRAVIERSLDDLLEFSTLALRLPLSDQS